MKLNCFGSFGQLIHLSLPCLCFFIIFLASCTIPEPDNHSSCRECHKIKLDHNHDFSCVKCHQGNNSANLKQRAHKDLIRYPASPQNAPRFCGNCHKKEVKNVAKSSHYTLKNEILVVWSAFFPSDTPPRIQELQGIENPKTLGDLVKDLLARRCLRCHVYYEGDKYQGVMRGTGCSACHMPIGSKVKHLFQKAKMENCLSCHYANFVGWDYIGRFEKDYPEDFRAPLEKGKHISRPYGVEWLQMEPDVHYKAGMTCTHCHKQGLFHVEKGALSLVGCRNCHKELVDILGHRSNSSSCEADCQACHAVWSVWDQGRSLMRHDSPDPEEWAFLSVQGSSEIERQLVRALEYNISGFKPVMSDKIHGGEYRGLWFQGFQKRRWAPVVLGLDKNYKMCVMRPLLDIELSYVDTIGDTVFDQIKAKPSRFYRKINPVWFGVMSDRDNLAPYCLPYHPHTISRADAIRTILVSDYLKKCSEEIGYSENTFSKMLFNTSSLYGFGRDAQKP